MNAFTFLLGMGGIDDKYLTAVLELPDAGQAEVSEKRSVLRLSKIILIAAILAGILGITAWATGGFDALFQQIAEIDGWGYGMDEVIRNAAEAVPPAQPETHPLQDDDSSVISIGQTYYDGDTFMIAYRFDDSIPADLTYTYKEEDADSYHFWPEVSYAAETENMLEHVRAEYGEESYQKRLGELMEERERDRELMTRYGKEYVDLGLMTEEQYDAMMASLDEEGFQYLNYKKLLSTDHDILPKILTPEEHAQLRDKFRRGGHAGVAIREYYIGDGIYFADGQQLGPDENGIVVDIYPTEDGDCLYGPPKLPEKYRNQESLTLTFRVVYHDKIIYIDMEDGVREGGRKIGEERITVTIPRSEKKS